MEIHKFRKHIEDLETHKFEQNKRYLKRNSLIQEIANELGIELPPKLEKYLLPHNNKSLISESNTVSMEQYYVSLLKHQLKEDMCEAYVEFEKITSFL